MITHPGTSFILWVLETTLKSTVAVLLAATAASMLRRKLPAASHLAWILGLTIAFSTPLVAKYVPSTSILTISSSAFAGSQSDANTTATVQESHPGDGAGALDTQAIDQNEVGSKWRNPLSLPSWALWVTYLWLVGFIAVISRCLFGLYSLRIIRKYGTRPITCEDLASSLDRLADKAGVSRQWDLRICANSELTLPMTWGVLRPTIVLPFDAEQWPTQRFEAVMLHELAHVRRFDFLSQLMAEVVCAAYWFHPIVWLGARAMRSDAELAADEAVIRSGLKPSEYASELLKVAVNLGNRKQPFAYIGTPAMNNSKSKLDSNLYWTIPPVAEECRLFTC